ncbi:MAG: PilZ domain-containing protein [Sulfuricaulis sp.]|nr:PilZ domain-containing protein [Sulfuricaulis sp.]
MTEKRQHSRSLVRLEVELAYSGGGTRRAETRDLGIGGLFVELTGEPLAMGTPLTITFLSTAHHPGPYSMRARVQRQTPDGLAMTFIEFSLDDLRFIEALLVP